MKRKQEPGSIAGKEIFGEEEPQSDAGDGFQGESMNAKRSVLAFVLILVAAFFMGGCARTLVNDHVKRNEPNLAHCSGKERVDDSTIAVLPVPVVAFFVPRADLNEIRVDEYLNRCGDASKLINRRVEVSRYACIPSSLTYFITLGVWQWCPASVEWEADVRP